MNVTIFINAVSFLKITNNVYNITKNIELLKRMKKTHFLTLSIVPFFLIVTGAFSHMINKERSEYQLQASSEIGLKIKSLPYLTTLSLGDPLYLDGLEVELTTSSGTSIIDDYSLFGYDTDNLGLQTIQVIQSPYSVSFEVYVTNALVRNTISNTDDLIISEIVNLSGNNYGVELFNNTLSTINLSDYALVLSKETDETINIALPNHPIVNGQTFTIRQESATNSFLLESNITSSLLDFTNTTSISLVHIENTNPIDSYTFSEEHQISRRHYKVNQPSVTYKSSEWIDTRLNPDDFGVHLVSQDIITIENQAKAFGRYVMFGAGMNAGGRVQEAFTQLKNEFELMSKASQDYFVTNKSTTIQGYNESGKFVTTTFREAYGRISYIASRSGNTSFIPGNTFNLSCDSIAPYVLIGIVVLTLGGYLVFRLKSKKS